MSASSDTENSGTVTFTSLEERRRTDRVDIALPVRSRPSDSEQASFDEVCTTINASRDGLYFSTQCPHYHPGMQLVLTFPYSTAPNARNVDFLARVVRVDRLPDGQLGIAVELLMTVRNNQRVRDFGKKF